MMIFYVKRGHNQVYYALLLIAKIFHSGLITKFKSVKTEDAKIKIFQYWKLSPFSPLPPSSVRYFSHLKNTCDFGMFEDDYPAKNIEKCCLRL